MTLRETFVSVCEATGITLEEQFDLLEGACTAVFDSLADDDQKRIQRELMLTVFDHVPEARQAECAALLEAFRDELLGPPQHAVTEEQVVADDAPWEPADSLADQNFPGGEFEMAEDEGTAYIVPSWLEWCALCHCDETKPTEYSFHIIAHVPELQLMPTVTPAIMPVPDSAADSYGEVIAGWQVVFSDGCIAAIMVNSGRRPEDAWIDAVLSVPVEGFRTDIYNHVSLPPIEDAKLPLRGRTFLFEVPNRGTYSVCLEE